jgi:hypothetical protein
MNWPSARSSRASPPFSTTKREPESFAAASKSMRPSASPSSKCSFAEFSRFGSPQRRTSKFALSSPTGGASGGSPSGGTLGMTARASSSSLESPLSSSSPALSASFRLATSAISACARASSFCALAWPISLEAALPAGLRFLQAGDRGAAALVERDQLLGLRLSPAVLERAVEPLRILANPSDVEHVPCPVSEASAGVAKWKRGSSPRRERASRSVQAAASAAAWAAARERSMKRTETMEIS